MSSLMTEINRMDLIYLRTIISRGNWWFCLLRVEIQSSLFAAELRYLESCWWYWWVEQFSNYFACIPLEIVTYESKMICIMNCSGHNLNTDKIVCSHEPPSVLNSSIFDWRNLDMKSITMCVLNPRSFCQIKRSET